MLPPAGSVWLEHPGRAVAHSEGVGVWVRDFGDEGGEV